MFNLRVVVEGLEIKKTQKHFGACGILEDLNESVLSSEERDASRERAQLEREAELLLAHQIQHFEHNFLALCISSLFPKNKHFID